MGRPHHGGRRRTSFSAVEVAAVLDLLHLPQFVDLAPAQVWAILLDAGRYVASISTMYRVLRAHDEIRERRRQASHPARVRPELVAHGPNQVWSWDIVRHEALLNRAVVKGHRCQPVAAGW
jgi:putative transposase